MTLKTFVYSFALLVASSYSTTLKAQEVADSLKEKTEATAKPFRGVQYNSPEEAAAALANQKKLPLFAGVSVSADVVGLGMSLFSPFGQYEAAARINMRGKYFPIAEVGVGVSDHTDESSNIHYKVHSPYFRVGMDYNLMKSIRSGNRIFVGARYGFSSFKYDLDGPDIVDPIYGTTLPFHYEGLKGANHWGEVVAGLEAKIWGIFHLGWSIRYRFRFANKKSIVGSPWYVPGYGRNKSTTLGGTFNVIFDI